MRLQQPQEGEPVLLGIDDAALLLDVMAFTGVMSVEFPFFEMVHSTSDFVQPNCGPTGPGISGSHT